MLQSKGNNENTQNGRENICKQCNQQGVNLQNITAAYMAQVKKQTIQSKKQEEDLNKCFSKENVQMAKGT